MKQYFGSIWKILAIWLVAIHCSLAAQFGDFTYTDEGTTITITDYPESAVGAVLIPATIVGKPVTRIGDSAFYDCQRLTSITIPSGVTSIGSFAFSYCSRLTSITIPSGVTRIGGSTFYGCTSLTSITIPSGVTSIGSSAFFRCTSLASITIPSGVISIQNNAFSLCTSLKSACFMGSAPPSFGDAVFFEVAPGFAVYFFNGATGFTVPTWKGYPSVNMGAFSAKAPWLLSHGFAYNTNLTEDPNADGVNLLMAYALNLDPKQNLSGAMPRPVMAGNGMSLNFYAGAQGVNYKVEASPDLQTWSESGVSLSAPDMNSRRTATANVNDPAKFMRIVAIY